MAISKVRNQIRRDKFGTIRERLQDLFKSRDIQDARRWVNLIRLAARNPDRFRVGNKEAMRDLITDTLSYIPASRLSPEYWGRLMELARDEGRSRHNIHDETIIYSGCNTIYRIASMKLNYKGDFLEQMLWRYCRSPIRAYENLVSLRKAFPRHPCLKVIEPPQSWWDNREKLLRKSKRGKKRL